MPNCFLASYDDDSQTGNFLAAGLSKEARSIGHTAIVRSSTFPFTLLIAYAMLIRWTKLQWMEEGREGNEMI